MIKALTSFGAAVLTGLLIIFTTTTLFVGVVIVTFCVLMSLEDPKPEEEVSEKIKAPP